MAKRILSIIVCISMIFTGSIIVKAESQMVSDLQAKIITNPVNDAIQVVCNEKNIPYIGNQIYTISAYWSEEGYPALSKVETEGVMTGLEMDFDEDGEQEIFAVTYEPSAFIQDGKAIHFSIWKKRQNRSELLTETEVLYRDWEGNYHDVSCLDGTSNYYEGSVFVRKYKGTYEFYYENYGAGIFATGQNWFLKGFRFENNQLVQMDETESIYYFGSPVDVLWTFSDEELEQYDAGLAHMREKYCSLGFAKPNITFNQLTVDQNTEVYSVLRMKLESDSSIEEVMNWFSNHQEPLKTFWYQVEDESDSVPMVFKEFSIPASVHTQENTYGKEDYILPNSNTEYLTVEQLISMGLTAEQLRLARNEIFARHGRRFNTPEIQQYFEGKPWYVPRYSPEEFDSMVQDIFNDIEFYNIDVIRDVEEGNNNFKGRPIGISEIYTKLMEHYQKTEPGIVKNITVEEDGNGNYWANIYCGVSENQEAMQRLYDLQIEGTTGMVTGMNVISGSNIDTFYIW